jgi:UDP-N-acetylglucosamine 2-epimerase (non-hydrolysing)
MSHKKLKIATILGTRPEIIRLSRVMDALDKDTEHIIIHTGQNYDYELNQIFFDDMEIRKPDFFLGVDTSSLGAVLGGILIESEKILAAEKPDAVVILGDTNSAIAGMMARRMKIPVYHMEAGNRCFDFNVPEETNRRIVDHLSDFNLVYTEHARRHLLSEGIPHRRIYLTGSPMREVLNHYSAKIDASEILEKLDLEPQKYILVSMHREENVDYADKLSELLRALEMLAERYKYPIVVSTHPRTQKRIDSLGYKNETGLIQFLKPFGFSDYNLLQKKSFCVVSDSGTISEESSILEFPAVTIRNALERPEAMDAGCITMTGTYPDRIVDCVSAVTRQFSEGAPIECPVDYQIENTSQRVVRLILGTAKLAHRWQGIENLEKA